MAARNVKNARSAANRKSARTERTGWIEAGGKIGSRNAAVRKAGQVSRPGQNRARSCASTGSWSGTLEHARHIAEYCSDGVFPGSPPLGGLSGSPVLLLGIGAGWPRKSRGLLHRGGVCRTLLHSCSHRCLLLLLPSNRSVHDLWFCAKAPAAGLSGVLSPFSGQNH